MIWLERKPKLFISLILLSAFIFSCKPDAAGTDNNSSLFDFSSDTEKAVELVRAANDELMRIKILYNENQNTLKDLEEASKKGETEKIKIISKTLADTINTGFVFADSAKSKIQEAQGLNIHQDYKDYLSLEEQGLNKQLDAFQSLYEAAKLLNETTGLQDKEQAEKAGINFKEKEASFQKKMEEAKQINEQADKFYSESMKRWKQQNR